MTYCEAVEQYIGAKTKFLELQKKMETLAAIQAPNKDVINTFEAIRWQRHLMEQASPVLKTWVLKMDAQDYLPSIEEIESYRKLAIFLQPPT